MREYFDDAYESLTENWAVVVEALREACSRFFVELTIPIWIIPYVLFFRKNERKKK